MPEIGGAARIGFNPVRGGNRLAALGAGIALGQIAEIHSGHGASPLLDDRRIGQDSCRIRTLRPVAENSCERIESFRRHAESAATNDAVILRSGLVAAS